MLTKNNKNGTRSLALVIAVAAVLSLFGGIFFAPMKTYADTTIVTWDKAVLSTFNEEDTEQSSQGITFDKTDGSYISQSGKKSRIILQPGHGVSFSSDIGKISCIVVAASDLDITTLGNGNYYGWENSLDEYEYEEITYFRWCGTPSDKVPFLINTYGTITIDSITFEISESPHTHSYDEGRVAKEPTFGKEGQKIYTCTACGMKRKETIPRLTIDKESVIDEFVEDHEYTVTKKAVFSFQPAKKSEYVIRYLYEDGQRNVDFFWLDEEGNELDCERDDIGDGETGDTQVHLILEAGKTYYFAWIDEDGNTAPVSVVLRELKKAKVTLNAGGGEIVKINYDGNEGYYCREGKGEDKLELTLYCEPLGIAPNLYIPGKNNAKYYELYGGLEYEVFPWYDCGYYITNGTKRFLGWSTDGTKSGIVESFEDGAVLYALWVEDSDFWYSVENGTALITGYQGNEKRVVIPKTIDGFTVTGIDQEAFYEENTITEVVIPDGVRTIGDYAFYNCSGIKAITVPDSVKTIGIYAFRGCSSLTDINIPSGVQAIGKYAFSKCKKLTSLILPNNISTIEKGLLFSCSGLKTLFVPAGVTEIGANAFEYCESLKDIYVPSGITKIGKGAFDSCPRITEVYYESGTDDWGKIDIGGLNDVLASANIHYNSHIHLMKMIPGIQPTCTKAGKKTSYICETCGKKFDAQLELMGTNDSGIIPATGHRWNTGKITKTATALSSGIKTYSCTVCNQKKNATIKKLTPTIKLSAKKKTIKKKKSVVLIISNLAKGDSIKSVKSNKSKIAAVKKIKRNKYKITGKRKGKAVITVALKSGKKATCTVIVK